MIRPKGKGFSVKPGTCRTGTCPAVPIQALKIISALSAENEQMTAKRIGANYLLRLHSQTVKPIAQINRTTREKDLRARRQIDHSALRIARRTRDSAFSFTKPPTQMRTPFGNAISIVPVPPSLARGQWLSSRFRRRQQRPSLPACFTHYSERNEVHRLRRAPLTRAAAFHAERQLYSRLSEMPCRRATTATLPFSASTSSSSADFSAGLHFRRRVMISPSVTSPPSGVLQKDCRQEQTLRMSPASAQYGAGHTLTPAMTMSPGVRLVASSSSR